MDQHNDDQPAAPTTLGAAVRLARARAGLSLRHLEAITGISRPMLHRLERNQMDEPSPALLQRLADALEIDSSDLFAFIGYQPSNTLPSLMPYLRAKYHLPPDAAAEAHAALDRIVAKYDQRRSDTAAEHSNPDTDAFG